MSYENEVKMYWRLRGLLSEQQKDTEEGRAEIEALIEYDLIPMAEAVSSRLRSLVLATIDYYRIQDSAIAC